MAGKKGMKRVKPHDESELWPEYYKKRYPEMSDEECIARATWFKKSCMYQCIEYYEKRYPELTHEEHLKMLHDKKSAKKQAEHKREDNYQCIEYYEKRYPELTHEEHERLLSEAKASYLAKRPDNTDVNNPSHRSKTTEKQRRERSVLCIEYYEKKYPLLTDEERRSLMAEKIKEVDYKRSLVPQSTQLQYYLSKGMSEDEAKEALSKRQCTFSLEKCINKYGEEKGRRIFEERQAKWSRKLRESFLTHGDGRSPQSIFAKSIIEQICSILNIDIPKKEKYISNKDGRHFAYDFTINKKIIEFNGDYWHANPSIYSYDFFNKTVGLYAHELWEKDKIKKECAITNGYKVLTIWESDYKEDPEGTVKKCIRFLND